MDKKERDIVKKSYATVVRRRRAWLGFSQEKLAEEARLDRSTIQRVENKYSIPEETTIIKLAEGLNMSYGTFFEEVAQLIKAQLNEDEEK